MSGATPIRLPLSRRQADALAVLLGWFAADGSAPSVDESQALREVAEKLAALKESR